ncbi:MAG TPA: long-chain fatty acid--CoA ligase [Spirochaetales bacterium]|nr:long-chain fatty acid--CoA ligase [Spirochaetales bacterium]
MTVAEEVLKAIAGWGSHPVFIELTPNKAPIYVSAEEFRARIEKTTRLLRDLGIKQRYLATLFLENSIDFVSIFLSLINLGAIPIALKMDYRKVELDEIFTNAEPQSIIAEQSHLPALSPYLPGRLVIARSGGQLILQQSPVVQHPPAEIPEEIASINYTYRGYGFPLGAMIPHAQYLMGARVLQAGLKGSIGESMLVILPMPHIFTLIGCLLVPLLFGMTSIIARTAHPRLLFEYIRNYHIDYITSVPEIYELLLKFRHKESRIDSLKAFVCGGSSLSENSYEKIVAAFDIDLLHGYGLTEFTPVSRNIRGSARSGTIGPLCSDVCCKIASPDRTGAGEILLTTPYMTRAYYRRPQETAHAYTAGWFKTGDIGRLHNDHLIFLKEKKNTRKINGNIVDLNEVRKAVLMHNRIVDVKVNYRDNALSAQVVFNRDNDFKKEVKGLRNFLKGIIAVYKIPKNIIRKD